MPTIKDIAREAGVSHGTVSNVINGRGNVSVEKIRMVWKAAEKLGYQVNTRAQSLRQGKSRSIAVILPGIEFEHCAAMYEVIQSEFIQYGYSVQLYSTRSLEAIEEELLAKALSSGVCALITSSCLPDAAAYYREKAADLPIVFLQREGSRLSNVMHAGFDSEQAGREIAQYLRRRRAAKIGVFTDAASQPDTALFLRGFQAVYPQGGASVHFLDCSNYQADLQAFEFFNADTAFDYIVCSDRRREGAVRAACAYAGRCPMPQFITIVPRAAATEPDVPVYELDYKRLAHKVVRHLLGHLEEGAPLPEVLSISNNGFRGDFAAAPLPAARKLRMLTMASPSTAALARLTPHLEKSTGIRLELTVLPALRDVYDVIQSDLYGQYDLIRTDVAWQDELAEKVYRPLEEIPFPWDELLSQTVPELRDNYSTAHGVRCCVPYDPSTQLLFYRRDLFADPTYKRMYFETFREELAPPETFADYNRIAGFFTRTLNPASPIQYGSTAAIGNVGMSPSEFMPRLFEEGGRLLNGLGQITLDTPEALRALKNYQETYQYSDKTVYDFWKNVLEGFADGSAAMTVVFINYASHILNLKMSSIAGKLGFAPVPGGRPLLGGGVIGITRNCSVPETACAFLSWLYSDLVAPVFTLLGGLSPCKSAYGNRDINEMYPWLSAARKSFSSAQRRGNSGFYQNFSELRLEDILAAQIQRAVLGVCSAKEALRRAQASCEEYFRPWGADGQ
ncbi:MAG: extracellular solute-binding protein [Oscillibacter sp.]|nr:extracellular solute-binding protein [uncultured Oscillibacter sp.]MCI8970845.1 extracellular solute-binding protein [Oscillibacter sp.]